MAEVYWDLEWTLQQQGFDYAYDKRLYDRLREGHARPVREHFSAGLDYPGQAGALPREPRRAACGCHVRTGQGQCRSSAHLLVAGPALLPSRPVRRAARGASRRIWAARPDELPNSAVQQFYASLLDVLRRPAVRQGQWQLLECRPAYDGDGSFDNFIAWTWQLPDGERLLVTVNFSAHPGQCYVRLASAELGGAAWLLTDLLGDARYERDGDELQSRGLYLNVAPWQCHAFEMSAQVGSLARTAHGCDCARPTITAATRLPRGRFRCPLLHAQHAAAVSLPWSGCWRASRFLCTSRPPRRARASYRYCRSGSD